MSWKKGDMAATAVAAEEVKKKREEEKSWWGDSPMINVLGNLSSTIASVEIDRFASEIRDRTDLRHYNNKKDAKSISEKFRKKLENIPRKYAFGKIWQRLPKGYQKVGTMGPRNWPIGASNLFLLPAFPETQLPHSLPGQFPG